MGTSFQKLYCTRGSQLNKTFFVAGVAGFIGTNLAKELLARGHKVIGVDNFSSGSLTNIAVQAQHPNFEFFNQSVCDDLDSFEKSSIDFIFHLASPASPPRYMALPLETMDANTIGTKNLIALAQKTNARIIYASTSEIYGDPLESPQRESYWGNVNPIGPRSVYDEAKRFGETLVSHYQRHNLVNAVIVRIFNTYGPHMDPYDGRVVSNFIRQAIKGEPLTIYGDGKQTRSFCFVDDMVEALIKVAESDESGPINLGNPFEFTLIQLAEKVSKAVPGPGSIEFLPLPQDDPKVRQPDIAFAKSKLGWEPKIQLDEGIVKTTDWMKKTLKAQNA